MAIPNEQAMEASRTGGVLSPASKDPHSPEYTQLDVIYIGHTYMKC